MVRLADGGENSIDKAVAPCANCHRKMHILVKKSDKAKLQSRWPQMEERHRPSGWGSFAGEIRFSQVTQNLLASSVAELQRRLPTFSTAFQGFADDHGDGSPPRKPVV